MSRKAIDRPRSSRGDRGKPYTTRPPRPDTGWYKNLVKLSSLAYTEGVYAKPRAIRAARNTRRHRRPRRAWPERRAPPPLRRIHQARAAAFWYDVCSAPLLLRSRRTPPRTSSTLNRRYSSLGELTFGASDQRRHFSPATITTTTIPLHGPQDFSATKHAYDKGLIQSAPEITDAFPGGGWLGIPCAADETATHSRSSTRSHRSRCVGVETANERWCPAEEALFSARCTTSRRCRERLDFELGVITSTGYAVLPHVADFIKAARGWESRLGPVALLAGSIVPTRSASPSLSFRFDLLFERFLNPELGHCR